MGKDYLYIVKDKLVIDNVIEPIVGCGEIGGIVYCGKSLDISIFETSLSNDY